MQTARREELASMHKVSLERSPVEQCDERETIGTKWIDNNKGDGDRFEIRSRLVATDLKGSCSQDVHLARRRLQCDTTIGSRATLVELDDAESKQADSYKRTFIDISPSRRRVFVELLPA